jgi:Domain of unknown function (DUF1330)
VRGNKSEVVEFKDLDTALTCYHSPEYAKTKVLRNGKADLSIAVIEEYGRMADPSDADILQPVFSTAGGCLWLTTYFRDGAIPA